MSELVSADLVWTGAGFVANGRVRFDAAGRIEAVGTAAEVPGRPTRVLGRRALFPGLVNAHSHAFQRGLRGRGERFPAGAGSFWSWREAMYGLVERMDADRMHALSLLAFREMLDAGITSVGEFHYLHHDGSGAGWELDEAVLAAARDAGIRIVLLFAYYRTGGIGEAAVGRPGALSRARSGGLLGGRRSTEARRAGAGHRLRRAQHPRRRPRRPARAP